MSTCLFIYFFYKMSRYWFLIEFRYISDNLFHKSFQMEEKQEEINSTNLMKKVVKKWRFWAIILFCFIVAFSGGNTKTEVQKVDIVQERINRIIQLYSEESTFDRIERIWTNDIAIIFTETPDLWIEDEIDSITRWQAVNLSNDVNWTATVKTYVWWTAQMFCIATKWTVNDCIDYR